ncbi:MAG: ATP synthase F1 subunit epsilon [Firmicutes bacterium]|nr:ATP synthase F1 subunit epsilon [Alicyclobacillaceae bacterium]MCL6497701.1 ATP synthase F1 subunit epsilon [Bacillota bacterium]
MASLYPLKVVTPERTVWHGEAQFLVTRSTEGEIGILAHHVQLITPLVSHIMQITDAQGAVRRLHVAGGFLEVGPDQVVVLADAAEFPEEIDRERAEAARQRARSRLDNPGPEVDRRRAELALIRAENRLKLVQGH